MTKACQHKGPTQQAQQVSKASPAAEPVIDAARHAIMPKGGKIALLPSVLSSSRSKYFATLLAALFASGEPFDDFLKTSSTFLATCCAAFESVWPYLNVTVETDDVLFNVVSIYHNHEAWLDFDLQGYQRLLERRGKIHDLVKTTLQSYFASQQYSPAEIVEWVEWFCGTYGSPVFYETPIPQDGPWDSTLPEYKVRSLCTRFEYMQTGLFRNPVVS